MITKKHTSRRAFIVENSKSLMLGSGLGLSLLDNDALAKPTRTQENKVLIVIFLRGGADGLSIVHPARGKAVDEYKSLRGPETRILQGIPLKGNDGKMSKFNMHPALGKLKKLYDQKEMSFILGSGFHTSNTSHFLQQKHIEMGWTGNKLPQGGYLGRAFDAFYGKRLGKYLGRLTYLSTTPSLSLSSPISQGIAIQDFANFGDLKGASFRADRRYQIDDRLTAHYDCDRESVVCTTGDATIQSVREALELKRKITANSDDKNFETKMRTLAKAVSTNKLKFVTLDLNGWDTHIDQGNDTKGQRLHDLLERLAGGIRAFYDTATRPDINSWNKCNILVMSEFGRTARQNNGGKGTDHGYGSVSMVFGNSPYPSLANYGDFYFPETDQEFYYKRLNHSGAFKKYNKNVNSFYRFIEKENMLPVNPKYTFERILANLLKKHTNSEDRLNEVFAGYNVLIEREKIGV